ncbi:CoA-transferase family III family protein 28 [Achromobacter xylosoxidans A8]|uniref:CoA-transferase family III family protein 28 n=1 Tax=Achromobacter xylosoxidans (strain A8) TaxID=762376 RepID=E3HQ33_ACHXA|nr:CaiB/BaiF CoA-transferase family protein [Achromobacter xylosoxidans]ADP17191.1 CoA-transferase family III family protein 28 [Achromobacter xylosoxidans A8]
MLSGIRVVEICGLGPGPFCAMHLADLGADVIAVERADPVRRADERQVINRGKRTVALDLKSAQGRDTVLKLAEQADVLIEGMRPGVMERLGLGPDPLHTRNPRLVYGRMTGWGQTGPLAQAAGHDNNYIALSGALYYTGTRGEAPISPITALGDIGGGALYLAIGILAGVMKARETGLGTVVDAAIVDGSAHLLSLMLATKAKGLVTGRRGENVHDSSHFFSSYCCKDGEYITLGALEPQFYALLLRKLELDPVDFPQWERQRWPALRGKFAAIFVERTRAEWCALLEGTDVCFGAVFSPEEAARHPHMQARGVYFERDGRLEARAAPRFDGVALPAGEVPTSGQHTAEVLAALERGAGEVWLPR